MDFDYRIDAHPIETYLTRDGRGARERLCAKMGATGTTLDVIRRTGRVPQGKILIGLADAIGVKVDDLVIRKPKKPRN